MANLLAVWLRFKKQLLLNYLKRLQLLISRFIEAKVEIGNIHMIQSLSDSTLTRLGLTTIGDRVRLRTKDMESPSTSTPAAKLPSAILSVPQSITTNSRFIVQLLNLAWNTLEFLWVLQCLLRVSYLEIPKDNDTRTVAQVSNVARRNMTYMQYTHRMFVIFAIKRQCDFFLEK